MGRKKKNPVSEESLIEVSKEANKLQQAYMEDLDVNPRYSLEVDP